MPCIYFYHGIKCSQSFKIFLSHSCEILEAINSVPKLSHLRLGSETHVSLYHKSVIFTIVTTEFYELVFFVILYILVHEFKNIILGSSPNIYIYIYSLLKRSKAQRWLTGLTSSDGGKSCDILQGLMIQPRALSATCSGYSATSHCWEHWDRDIVFCIMYLIP